MKFEGYDRSQRWYKHLTLGKKFYNTGEFILKRMFSRVVLVLLEFENSIRQIKIFMVWSPRTRYLPHARFSVLFFHILKKWHSGLWNLRSSFLPTIFILTHIKSFKELFYYKLLGNSNEVVCWSSFFQVFIRYVSVFALLLWTRFFGVSKIIVTFW